MEVPKAAIQFDIDGVIANLAPVMLPRMNALARLHGQEGNFKPSDIATFNWVYDTCVQRFGMSHDEAFQTQLQWGDPDVVSRAELYKGAKFGLRVLEALYSGKINYVTSRRASTREVTLDWFHDNLPFINPRRILQREEGDPRRGPTLKMDTLGISGAQRAYEDEPDTITHFGPTIARIVDRPYNRGTRGFVRLRGWPQIVLHEAKQRSAK
jgi:hypothetical protein